MRKIDVPLLVVAISIAAVCIAIVLEDYPRYADCAQQEARALGLCDLPWWDYSGAWVAIFTIVLTLSTAALWWVTRETLKHSRTDSDRQAKQTETSLAISKKAADAAVAGNRAWLKLTVELTGPLIFGTDKILLETAVAVENVGKSPATRVRVSSGMSFFNPSSKFDGLRFAVNKSQISVSERVTCDRGRTAEDIARQQTIGDVVFPGDSRPIKVEEWGGTSRNELRYTLSDGDGTEMVAVYFSVSAEYRTNTGWANTTVVHIVEKAQAFSPEEHVSLFDSNQREFPQQSIRLRKLDLYTSAT